MNHNIFILIKIVTPCTLHGSICHCYASPQANSGLTQVSLPHKNLLSKLSSHIRIHVNVGGLYGPHPDLQCTVKAPHIHKWKMLDETKLNFKHVRNAADEFLECLLLSDSQGSAALSANSISLMRNQ